MLFNTDKVFAAKSLTGGGFSAEKGDVEGLDQ